MNAQDRYFIGPGLRDKLRQVIGRFDGTPIGGGVTRIPTRLQDMRSGGGGGGEVQAGFFHGAWPKNGYKTVTLASDTDRTVTVYNPIVSIPDRGQRRVIFMRLSIDTAQTSFSQFNFITCEC